MIRLHQGAALDVLVEMSDNSIDSIVTDPPYGLSREPDAIEVLRHWLAGDDYEHGGGGFMGKSWDSFVPGPSTWKECLRVLKPGGHLLCFAGSRTVDLMGMAIRLGGFEIRDQLQWLCGSGFPKSMNVAKAIDKKLGVEGGVGSSEAANWQGWGTALKPAHEPIILARKPFRETVAKNVLRHGTGAINVDATRVAAEARPLLVGDCKETDNNAHAGRMDGSLAGGSKAEGVTDLGRWPANVILDHEAGALLDEQSGTLRSGKAAAGGHKRTAENMEKGSDVYGGGRGISGTSSTDDAGVLYGDSGGASRFFYCAKTAKSERNAGLPDGLTNDHPTVKPVKLMEWLVKMVTPPGGTVLDPFCGSGTTMVAAERLGFDGIGIDRDDEDKYLTIARHRIRHASGLEYPEPEPPAPTPSAGESSDDLFDLFPDSQCDPSNPYQGERP